MSAEEVEGPDENEPIECAVKRDPWRQCVTVGLFARGGDEPFFWFDMSPDAAARFGACLTRLAAGCTESGAQA